MEQRTSTGHKRSQLPASLYSLPQGRLRPDPRAGTKKRRFR